VIRTVTVGPFPIYFGNVNKAMGLRGHHHTAQVTLVYGHSQGDHGYPSFKQTNDALRERLEQLTGVRRTFKDATNEDVAYRLFAAMATFVDDSWMRYGGRYWLETLHLDVEGVQDDIGHDNGVTRYTVSLPATAQPMPRAAYTTFLPDLNAQEES
jgi:3',5'-cyclic AMP phosphodiesterase CpdA